MDIAIRSRNVEVPAAVRDAVEEKMARLTKYVEGMNHAEVRLLEEKNPRIAAREICEVTLHGQGHVVRAKAASEDVLTSVDQVIEKLEHQLERLKGRIVGRTHPKRSRRESHPLAASGEFVPEITDREEGERHLVKSKTITIEAMTTEEAMTRMEMVGHDFYVFINSETGRPAVVYDRDDGDIGLIDTV